MSRTGIRERRVAAAHETTASMAAVAGARAIAVAGLDPDEIDLILVATLTPDYWMPSTAALVKEAIGNRRAAAMDVAAACSGFVYAYATAHAYVTSGMARHVLVIGAELLTRFLDYTDRSTCILFGDGAGAVVVSASDEPTGPHGIELTTEPQGAYMIWLPAGGSKSPSSAETVARGEHFIRMEGKETYRFATKTLASSALAAIERAGLHPDEIDLVIPHQANVRIIEAVAKGLGFPMERIFVNVDRYGNTSAASVPLALAEAVDTGRIKVGDTDRVRRLRGRLHLWRGGDGVVGRPGPRRPRRGDRPGRHPRPPAGRLGLGRPHPPAARRRPRGARGRWTSPSTTSSRANRSRPARPPQRPRPPPPTRPPDPHGGPRMIDLTGKVAIVTGGSRGIGRAVSLMLGAAGRRRRLHRPRRMPPRRPHQGRRRGPRPALDLRRRRRDGPGLLR